MTIQHLAKAIQTHPQSIRDNYEIWIWAGTTGDKMIDFENVLNIYLKYWREKMILNLIKFKVFIYVK